MFLHICALKPITSQGGIFGYDRLAGEKTKAQAT